MKKTQATTRKKQIPNKRNPVDSLAVLVHFVEAFYASGAWQTTRKKCKTNQKANRHTTSAVVEFFHLCVYFVSPLFTTLFPLPVVWSCVWLCEKKLRFDARVSRGGRSGVHLLFSLWTGGLSLPFLQIRVVIINSNLSKFLYLANSISVWYLTDVLTSHSLSLRSNRRTKRIPN